MLLVIISLAGSYIHLNMMLLSSAVTLLYLRQIEPLPGYAACLQAASMDVKNAINPMLHLCRASLEAFLSPLRHPSILPLLGTVAFKETLPKLYVIASVQLLFAVPFVYRLTFRSYLSHCFASLAQNGGIALAEYPSTISITNNAHFEANKALVRLLRGISFHNDHTT